MSCTKVPACAKASATQTGPIVAGSRRNTTLRCLSATRSSGSWFAASATQATRTRFGVTEAHEAIKRRQRGKRRFSGEERSPRIAATRKFCTRSMDSLYVQKPARRAATREALGNAEIAERTELGWRSERPSLSLRCICRRGHCEEACPCPIVFFAVAATALHHSGAAWNMRRREPAAGGAPAAGSARDSRPSAPYPGQPRQARRAPRNSAPRARNPVADGSVAIEDFNREQAPSRASRCRIPQKPIRPPSIAQHLLCAAACCAPA